MSERRVSQLLLALILVSAGVLLAALIINWQFAYSSDYGMIGLIAKRILEKGEHPIFVCSVGYQGMLLEGSAVALIFKWFGIGPITLNFAPLAFFLLFLGLFYRVVRNAFDPLIALVSTLFFLVSSPAIYGCILRTHPNLIETFDFGMILFLLYSKLLRSLNEGRSKSLLSGVSFAAGLVVGFGMYTYGLFVYFIGAIGLHASLIYLRDLRRLKGRLQVRDFLFADFKVLGRRAEIILGILNSLVLFFWVIAIALCLFNQHELFELGLRHVKVDPLTFFRDSSVGLLILFLGSILVNYWSLFRQNFRVLILGWVGLAIGYFPALFYTFIQKGPKGTRMGVSGDLSAIWQRLRFFYSGNARFLYLNRPTLLNILAAIAFFFCLAYFVRYGVKKCRDFVAGGGASPIGTDVPLFFFLPFVVIPLFCSADVVRITENSRYTLTLFIFYAVMIGFSSVTIFRKLTNKRLKFLAGFLAASLLLHNYFSFYTVFRDLPERYYLLDVISYLESKNIHLAYGEYWSAHSISFLTREDIRVEPIYSNYCHFYESEVSAASRIAVIDAIPGYMPMPGSQTEIGGHTYSLTERKEINGLEVRILEKLF